MSVRKTNIVAVLTAIFSLCAGEPSQAQPPTLPLFNALEKTMTFPPYFSLPFAQQRDYTPSDLTKILVRKNEGGRSQASIDLAYADRILRELSGHAGSYPPVFKTDDDKRKAYMDIERLSRMFDALIQVEHPHLEFLARAALINVMGHNLDIPNCRQKADQILTKLLTDSPNHVFGNYLGGTFLASTGQTKQAVPLLKKALALGVTEAGYALGLAKFSLGEKEQAVAYLKNYSTQHPADGQVKELINAMENGRLEIKQAPEAGH